MYGCDFQVLKDRTNYLIVVLCDDVSTEDLDEDMHLYLKTNTYLSRDCHWFWNKLRYALPDKPLTELLKGKESRWKDGWSGLEALAHAQNEAHKKAMRKCQLKKGDKKHCCQYRKPENCHAHGGKNHDDNTYVMDLGRGPSSPVPGYRLGPRESIQDEFHDEQKETRGHRSTNLKANLLSDKSPDGDQSSEGTIDVEARENNINEDGVVSIIEFCECKNYVNPVTINEVTKL